MIGSLLLVRPLQVRGAVKDPLELPRRGKATEGLASIEQNLTHHLGGSLGSSAVERGAGLPSGQSAQNDAFEIVGLGDRQERWMVPRLGPSFEDLEGASGVRRRLHEHLEKEGFADVV